MGDIEEVQEKQWSKEIKRWHLVLVEWEDAEVEGVSKSGMTFDGAL